jgi:hypothetical protein
MKKTKKTLSLILALVLVLSLVPAGTVIAAAEMVLNILVEPTLVFRNAYPFNNGRAVVYLYNGRTAIVNTRGEIIVNLDYHFAGPGPDGLIYVGLASNWIEDPDFGDGGYWSSFKYGVIDMNGSIVIPVIYDNMGSFSEGLARVGMGESDQSGDLIDDCYRAYI